MMQARWASQQCCTVIQSVSCYLSASESTSSQAATFVMAIAFQP